MTRLSFPQKNVTAGSHGLVSKHEKNRLEYQKIAGKPYNFPYIMVRKWLLCIYLVYCKVTKQCQQFKYA